MGTVEFGKWIAVVDRMPERSERGKDFLCVFEWQNYPWVEVTTLCDPICDVFEAESKDEEPYFAISAARRGAVVASDIKITHWMPLPEPPEAIQKLSLFEALGNALNPKAPVNGRTE